MGREAVNEALVFKKKRKSRLYRQVTMSQSICTSCYFVGNPTTVTKGSFFIEVILWLMLIIPGVIYSFWRLFTKYKACPQCGQTTMIPVSTPRGKELLSQIQINKQ